MFTNSKSCVGFEEFISSTILACVGNGSLILIGKVGGVAPPHLIMPITIEKSKPSMCHDERFLNFWIRDLLFSLDKVSDLPRYVEENHYQTVMDEKSGYDHVLHTDRSQTFFGLAWRGWYFCFRTIPFWWKASAYIYHSISLQATSYARSLGVPCSQYIDDRHPGQLRIKAEYRRDPLPSGFTLASAAAYIMSYLLTHLGYFIGLKKSILIPRQVVPVLDLPSDSTKQEFLLPENKKRKFISLRESILQNKTLSLKNIQKLAGKILSLILVVPGARLYTSAIYQAVSRLHFSTREILRYLDWSSPMVYRTSSAAKPLFGRIKHRMGRSYQLPWPSTRNS